MKLWTHHPLLLKATTMGLARATSAMALLLVMLPLTEAREAAASEAEDPGATAWQMSPPGESIPGKKVQPLASPGAAASQLLQPASMNGRHCDRTYSPACSAGMCWLGDSWFEEGPAPPATSSHRTQAALGCSAALRWPLELNAMQLGTLSAAPSSCIIAGAGVLGSNCSRNKSPPGES